MSDTEAFISDLPLKTNPAPTDLIEAEDASGNSYHFHVSTLLDRIEGVAALRLLQPENGGRYWLNYHTTPGDGGHGSFRGVTGAAPATYVDNGGTIIVPTGGDGSAAFLRKSADKSELYAKDFGARGDGVTDDTAAIQAALNALSNSAHETLLLSAATYLCNGNIYAYYDAILNPNYNSGALKGGRISVIGDGQMSRQDYKNGTYVGSVLNFATDKGLILSNGGTQKSVTQKWRNMSIIGTHSGKLIDADYVPLFSIFDHLFVGNDDRSGTGTAMYVADAWMSEFSNIECIGRNDLTGVGVGEGFVYEPITAGGGASLFKNITGAYFATALRFGHAYDAARAAINFQARAHKILNCHGQASAVGIAFQHGFNWSTVENFWGETNTTADVTIDNSSDGLHFIGGNFGSNPGDAATDGCIILGSAVGTATIDACKNVTFDGGYFFTDSPAIRKHPGALDIKIRDASIYNGGACFISVTAGDGGEVILENNDYFALSATSELSPARRCCIVTAGPTYTDAAQLLRRADFTVPFISAQLDMSAWRYAAEEVRCHTAGGSFSILLPLNLNVALGRKVVCRIIKSQAGPNTLTIDAGAGNTIEGSQTKVITTAYTIQKVQHRGTGSTTWDVVGN